MCSHNIAKADYDVIPLPLTQYNLTVMEAVNFRK